jgi:hypothetical protein
MGFIKSTKDLEDPHPVSAETPKWIALWIMDRCAWPGSTDPNPTVADCIYCLTSSCDELSIYTAQTKHHSEHRYSYTHAQKKRAAASHIYGRVRNRPENWHVDDLGNTRGNPASSFLMTQYMASLRRRKVIALSRQV